MKIQTGRKLSIRKDDGKLIVAKQEFVDSNKDGVKRRGLTYSSPEKWFRSKKIEEVKGKKMLRCEGAHGSKL